jgi:hypothetical protein
MRSILGPPPDGRNDLFPTFSATGERAAGMSGRRRGTRLPPAAPAGQGKEIHVFRAIADVLRQIGGAIATVVTLPFRALARLFGGASGSARGRRA